MSDWTQAVRLGRSGLTVGRLGVSAGYGAPAAAFEEAFERGCNYFYWGSSRRLGMGQAIRTLCRQGQRDRLVLVVQVYNRIASMMAGSVEKALHQLGLEDADVLLLGWYNSEPRARIMDAARRLQERGVVRHLALSGHDRKTLAQLAADPRWDILHVRYNAAHRGAESEFFPALAGADRPGTVSFTATRWGALLDPRKLPAGERAPRASDCYRFALSRPEVDVCLCGPKDTAQMREALATLERGPLDAEELAWMRRLGDHVHAHSWLK